jgi:hypothetical protein
VALFQGGIALPVAFFLERRLAKERMTKENPLLSLSALLAMSQALTLPALIVGYSMNPGSVPVMLAAIGGGHFLPYAWLHRTRIYSIFAFTVSFGGFAIQLALPQSAFVVILFFIAVVYLATAPLVLRKSRTLLQVSV